MQSPQQQGAFGAPQQQPYGAPQQQPYGAPQQQPYGAPQQQPYGTPQQQPGAFGPPPAFGAPQNFGTPMGFGASPVPISTTGAKVLAGITIFFACLPGGIVAMMLANQANTAAATGDAAGAKSKLMWSYVVSAISLVLGVPLMILYIMAQ